MRHRIVLNTILATLGFAAIAAAITNGIVDTTNAFPNTGAFIVKHNPTGQIFPICSGTLIAPGVFLTASHCTIFFQDNLGRLQRVRELR